MASRHSSHWVPGQNEGLHSLPYITATEGANTRNAPKKYYTVSKSTLDSLTGDFHELVNFFVIETQQIIFAENLAASTAVSSLTI